MKLEFADGTRLTVLNIFGGSQYIQGSNRDVLTIEVSPDVTTPELLRAAFQDPSKTSLLATVTTQEVADPTEEDPDHKKTVEVRAEIGTDYTIYLSCSNELRENKVEPGVLEPASTTEVNVVKVAQMTYMEKLLAQILAGQKQ